QQNTNPVNPSVQQQNSNETDRNTNHRFTWNMEYKPDTINYLKITPTFSYAGTNTLENETVNLTRTNSTPTDYTSETVGNSQAPTYGFTALFNHRFQHRHNLSVYFNFNSGSSTSYQNPTYIYTSGTPTAPLNQMVNTYSRTNTY